MAIIKEFKEFAFKGNLVDLAVAVVLGAAFGKVVEGLLDGVIMPLIAMVAGKPDFTSLSTTINGTVFPYGKFIQALLLFVIVAFVIFIIVRGINKYNKKAADAPTGPTPSETLLAEIRDALKK